MTHRGPIIASLKRLLMCTRRSKTVIRVDGHTPPSSLAIVSTTTNCLESSPDSLNCKPRLTAAEFKRRRNQNLRRVSRDFSESDDACCIGINGDDSDTLRTLCSISTEDDLSRAGTKSPQNTIARETNLSCHAEICSLETADHCAKVQDALCHVVALTEDLVVTEYRTECRISDERPKMVVNNASICYYRQLNAELCEVNWPQTAQIEALHVSNNLTNFAQYQAGKCSAMAHQDACQRSPLRVHVLSEESEPRSACASITTSEPSVERLTSGCWPDGDAVGPDEAQVDAAECKRPSGDAEEAKCRDAACENATGPIQSSEKSCDSLTTVCAQKSMYMDSRVCGRIQINVRGQENPHRAISSTPDTYSAKNKHANDRFGTLSSELCDSLRRGLRGDDLVKRYLEKRDISDTVRARHRQRCGSISASIVDKILRRSAEAASSTTAAVAATATLRGRLPKTSSASATEVSNPTVVLSIAPSERKIRTAPVVSIVASVAAAANAIAAVARRNAAAASASTAGYTRTPEQAGGDMRRRKARLAIGHHHVAKILVPVGMNLRARQREQRAA